MKIVTAEEMRQIDRDAAAKGLPTEVLMANAGRAVAEEVKERIGDMADRRVLVLVGPGNNGGDGLVAASHLQEGGAKVDLYIWSRKTEGDANFAATQAKGIPFVKAEEDEGFKDLLCLTEKADVIVDSLLGTGKARAISGTLKGMLEVVARWRRGDAVVAAVDLPTGLDADTGAVDEATVPADFTVTLGYPKPGLFLLPGARYVGELSVADIGFPPEPEGQSPLEMIIPELVKQLLPARPALSHKGTFGKVMVVAGSVNYVGAPFLACVSAGRVGAGLVTLACANTIYPILASKLVETTFLPLLDSPPGLLYGEAMNVLVRALPDYNVALLGPGLGQEAVTKSFVDQLLRWVKSETTGKFKDVSWVIDADGLNALPSIRKWPDVIPQKAVLTPHPAEMGRLLGLSVEQVQADRLGVARRAAAEWGRVVVLKGAYTIVASPDGQTFVNPGANPALASAGTGDVLAGAIAGLMAQGLDPKRAAVAGVFIHGLAGDLVRDEVGDAGALAGDLLDLLPEAISVVKAVD